MSRRIGQTVCRLAVAAGFLALCSATPAAAATPVPPIPQAPTSMPPAFLGAPAAPDPLYEPVPPRHPFMAANGLSEIHSDAYQSDTNQVSGPLGRDVAVLSSFQGGDCGSVTFDRQGRLLTVCVRPGGPTLYMFDPHTLATLASFALPPKMAGGSGATNPFQDFTGGGYFYLDNQDRVVVPTNSRHVYVISETPGPGFSLTRDYDVSRFLISSDRLTSALPDWSGRIWVESFDGVLVTIDPATGVMRSRDLREETENSFAVDDTGAVYVVSIKALYRLQAAADGTPQVRWRIVYPNSGIHEPGQVDAGSGTTPTIQDGYVTITDNADPLDIAVYRRTDGSQVCLQPIFTKGSTSDENSLIGAGDVMIAENNYGYTGPAATENGGLTAPGIERVDINADGSGCHVVWTNAGERVPSAVSKLSLASGLIYTYTKDDPSQDDPWYFTALDVRSGRVVYKRLAGSGLGFNNNYAPVTLGPDGTAYVGVLGGLVALSDAMAPNLPPPSPPAGAAPAGARGAPHHRLALHLRRLRGHRLRVTVAGPDARSVRRALFSVGARGRRLRATGRPARLSARFRLTGLHRGARLRIVADVRLRGGARVRLSRTARL
jgi:hypothetical protein